MQTQVHCHNTKNSSDFDCNLVFKIFTKILFLDILHVIEFMHIHTQRYVHLYMCNIYMYLDMNVLARVAALAMSAELIQIHKLGV